jgi:hypothetical protein
MEMSNIEWIKEKEVEFTLSDDIYVRYNIDKNVWYAHHLDEEKFENDEIIDEFEGELELFEGEYILTDKYFKLMKEIAFKERDTKNWY